jgi:hypothetical protein
MECTYCENKFSTKYSLQTHIKTARYCLQKRGKKEIKDEEYICSKCPKKFTSKRWLLSHQINCGESIENLKSDMEKLHEEKQNLQEQIIVQREYYEKQIQSLQDKLENIAIKAVQRPTTTNNMNKTQINNFIKKMEPLSREYLVDKAPNLTLEHVQKGASGYAEYALEYPLKDRVACVDYARRKIKFKDSEGNVVTDPEMMKLAPMFFDSIKDKSSQLVHSQNTPDMDSTMFEEVAKLFNTNADVKNGSTGVKTDFYYDFVKHVCSGSVVE